MLLLLQTDCAAIAVPVAVRKSTVQASITIDMAARILANVANQKPIMSVIPSADVAGLVIECFIFVALSAFHRNSLALRSDEAIVLPAVRALRTELGTFSNTA